MEDEDDLLQQALAMSMGGGEGGGVPAEADTVMAEAPAPAGAGASMFDSYDEELQNAIRMSMMEVQPGEEAPQPAGEVNQVCRIAFQKLYKASGHGESASRLKFAPFMPIRQYVCSMFVMRFLPRCLGCVVVGGGGGDAAFISPKCGRSPAGMPVLRGPKIAQASQKQLCGDKQIKALPPQVLGLCKCFTGGCGRSDAGECQSA